VSLLRVALVGAGTMGGLHARVLAQSPRTTLVRVIDPGSVAAEVAQRFGAEYSPELDLSGVDAVVVAARTEAHPTVAEAALDAGLPVLVEKPLAARLEDSEALVERSRRAGVPLMCGFLERYNPAVMTARAVAREVIQIHGVRHSPFVPRIATGVGTDLLIHDVDLTLQIKGEAPQSVKASVGYFHESSRENRAEDTADATMMFADGSLATLSASRVSHRKIRTLSLTEIDRLIEVDLLRRDVTIYRHVAEATTDEFVGYRQQTIIDIPALVTGEEPLAAQLNRFVDLATGVSGDVEAEREAILPAHRATEAALSSAVLA
jgi:predicted dehydrogenase